MYIVFLSASPAEQRQSDLKENEGGRVACIDADVARDERKAEEEKVELAAITLYLHLACLELGGGRRPSCASPSLAHFLKAPIGARRVYVVVTTCCVVGGEGKTGLFHCSRPSEDSDVGADAPRPPPARIKLPTF